MAEPEFESRSFSFSTLSSTTTRPCMCSHFPITLPIYMCDKTILPILPTADRSFCLCSSPIPSTRPCVEMATSSLEEKNIMLTKLNFLEDNLKFSAKNHLNFPWQAQQGWTFPTLCLGLCIPLFFPINLVYKSMTILH